jgi:hypothetical protein
MDEVLATIVHEGQHALDMADDVIPLPGKATVPQTLFAELRAWSVAAEFAEKNALSGAQAFQVIGKTPLDLAVDLVDGGGPGYKSLSKVTDPEMTEALNLFGWR